jgi:hypothetical protein
LLTIAIIETACHTAHLDVSAGRSLLTAPLPSSDMPTLTDSLSPSLHASDELSMLALLDSHGFDLGEDGETWEQIGTTVEGRPVFGLYGYEPIVPEPTSEDFAQSLAELAAAAGIVPEQRSA